MTAAQHEARVRAARHALSDARPGSRQHTTASTALTQAVQDAAYAAHIAPGGTR